MTPAAWFWTAVVSMIAGAVFSSAFHSLKDMTRTRLEEIAATRGRPGRTRRIGLILEDADGHSTAVALVRIVFNMIFAVAVVFWVAGVPAGLPGATAEPGETLNTVQATVVEVVGGIVLASALVWIFGLVIPHAVATYAAEPTVYALSPVIRACYIAQRPLAGVVGFFDEVVRRLSGRNERTEAEQVEAELMSVVEEAQEEGQFDQVERDMIQAVVDFRQTTVEQIMTPRTEVEAMELTNNLGEITRFIRTCRHSRIPVYEESLDKIVGMFYIKDLVRWLAGDGARTPGKAFELKSILRQPLFVPETKTIRQLLEELVERKVHIAVVTDEYGGTSGLVTVEDIVEEIFGEIQDEYEQSEDDQPAITVRGGERAAEIDARAYIHDANDEIRQLGVLLPEGEDYDTVGGLVVTTLGRIPPAGEVLRLEPPADAPAGTGAVQLTVIEAEPTRVVRVRLEVIAPEIMPASGDEAPEPAEPDGASEQVPAGRRDTGK